ncbi:DUF748 domain-containing protein [Maridesulfovibrio sp.]|uniref:DUF748 domain-containing protein n=1 Tax=Maridesulfovibrio sp. TaxID=2795000 RepID=UPI002A18C41A|nr:DUF748 domain-containing protein [Maridesulfovibrio sp.]
MLKKIHRRWAELSRWGKTGVIVGTVLVFYTLIGFFLIPFTARKVAVSKLPELLHRPVSIERVDFNPYTLRLQIGGLSIGKKDGEGNLFSFRTLDIDVDGFSIFRLSAALDRIEIIDPQVDVSIFRGGSSVSDLVPEGAADDEAAKNDEIFPFILRNMAIHNGTCRVYDKVRDVRHVVSDINLSIPFTSSLRRDNEKQVQPSLDMVINGTPFSLKGHSLPFNTSLRTEFDFSLHDAKLADYWAYLPIYETTVLKSGNLNTNLTLAFERSERLLPKMLVKGDVSIGNFDLAARKGPTLLKFTELALKFDELSILRRIIKIGSLKLTDPYLKVGLKKDGSPDLLDYLAPSIEAGEKSKEGEHQEEGPAPAAMIGDFVLENGRVDFTDNAFSNGFHKEISPIYINARQLSITNDSAGDYNFNIGSNSTEVISGHGEVMLKPFCVNGTVSVVDLDIPDYGAYLDNLPLGVASGKIGLGCDFNIAPESKVARLRNIRFGLDNLALTPKGGGKTLVGLGGFALANGTVDVGERSVFIDSINLNKAILRLLRDKKGRIDLLGYLDKGLKEAESRKSEPAVEPEPAEEKSENNGADVDDRQWQVILNRFLLDGSAVEFVDRAATVKTTTRIDGIRVGVDDLSFPEKNPFRLAVDAVINSRGSLSVRGQAGPQSLKGSGSVRLRKFRLRDFNGYLPAEMQFNIARGHIDVNGKWDFSAAKDPVAAYKGKVQLKDLLIRDNHDNSRFFHMNEFALRGIDFVSAPLRIKVESAGVVEPEVNLVREKDGTINAIRMLTGKRAAPVNATVADGELEDEVVEAESGEVETALQQDSQPAAPTAEQKEDNIIFVDRMFMSNGTVVFTDRAVSPAFKLEIGKMASAVRNLELPHGDRMDLSFNATLDQQAPLVAEGFIQPVPEGVDTDIKVSLANLDMTQLSPYTVKFIAYPVSTGMLSSDVAVKLRGKYISVDNVFDIYQFDVGDKVDNPDAPNIPIGLGLALLRDSSGNIRLDIPVDGDLSDPQFRLGRVIGRAIVNLIVKAVTSPFALIGALVGGSEDMDVLAFKPGTADLSADEMAKVESVAKAMVDRPGLKLEISGFSAPDDIPAMEEAEFRRQVAMPKYLELEADGKAPASVADVTISDDEYPDYLEDAYKEAPFEKPKNFLGFVETLPVPDMEKALRDHIKITDTGLADLARQRAEKIRNILTEKSGIPPERVFLKGLSATGKSTGPRVELGLQ